MRSVPSSSSDIRGYQIGWLNFLRNTVQNGSFNEQTSKERREAMGPDCCAFSDSPAWLALRTGWRGLRIPAGDGQTSDILLHPKACSFLQFQQSVEKGTIAL